MWCHKDETAKLAERRAIARRGTKHSLFHPSTGEEKVN
jgi:hypothetical protein